MTRRELEITLRAAAAVAKESEFFLIGSQAVHGYCRRIPCEVLVSEECDIYPKYKPETANLIDTELGRRSRFVKRHGFYADVVTPEIATLPQGWQARLKPLRAGRVTAWCLEANDLVVSKLAAGRLKDLEFVGALLQMRLADAKVVRQRIRLVSARNERARLRSRLRSVSDEIRGNSAAR